MRFLSSNDIERIKKSISHTSDNISKNDEILQKVRVVAFESHLTFDTLFSTKNLHSIVIPGKPTTYTIDVYFVLKKQNVTSNNVFAC